MADLRFIIDTEDDEDLGDDKYSRQPSVSGSARSPNPSSTAKTSDGTLPPSTTDPGKPQPRRRGPLSRPSRSTTTPLPIPATASVDKASPSRSPLAERKSVDSTESMDTVGYENYAHHSSSSNMPPSSRSTVSSRPLSSAPGDSNIPVRLTPVTGRVSRAKKGQPVHICDICKPHKTFTRAEHLRRHQLSHKPAAFQCSYPGCDKTFHRQDLLLRHTQRHEQDDGSGTGMTGTTSRRASHPPVERSPGGYLQPPVLPGNGLPIAEEMSTSVSYPGSVSSYSTSHRGSISGQGPMSPSANTSRSLSTDPSHSRDEYTLSTVHPFGIHGSMEGSPFHPPYGIEFEPRRLPSYSYTMSTDGLPSLTIPDSSIPGHLAGDSNWPSSRSNSPYSIPDKTAIRGFEDSPNADVSSFYVPQQYPSPQQPVYNPMGEYTSYPDDTGFYEYQSHTFPVRSPTPPIVALSAQPSDNLVTLGTAVPDPPTILGRQKGSAALLSPYLNAALLATLIPSAAALNAIPRYLDMYWKRFDTLFPLIHRRSVETSVDPILQCAMAAVGSQFLHSKEDRSNSHVLHAVALQEARCRPHWDIHVMQTILLCEFYGRFRGSRAMNRPSEPFQSLFSRVSNFFSSLSPFFLFVDSLTCSTIQDHLLFSLVLSPSNKHWHQYSTSSSQVAAPQTSVEYEIPANTSHRQWDQWILEESRRRLLAACFVLDTHTSIYHEHSISRPFPIPIPLTKPTQHLWAAQDPDAWETLLTSEPTQPSTTCLGDEETTASHVNTAPPLDLAVYLASESLRLPRRSPPSTINLESSIDFDSTERIRSLFSDHPVANTYLALHYTPLRDLLAVSGDSWLFSRKLLDPKEFQQRKANVRAWSGSLHAGVAYSFAAKALLAFFDHTNNNALDSTESVGEWIFSDISDYWALYVCALICWSLGHRTTRTAVKRDNTTAFSSTATTNPTSGKADNEAKAWLKTVADLSPEEAIQNVRARREALGVIAMVRRRLEGETVGGKSKLLVDAVRVLKTLEEDPNRGRF
ncbi:hypothetical protein GGR51DRAFT_82269 [Nemania sp. FL0031]|nr:hypothetical protein GGR51DRAFT_82269 [Nemania sp. FL0031]